ncbi:hypothetical protein A1O3_04212 [Capronia epimyces CBS 606.96]|uniref:Uncharacterized protein n=1 Tax=Capronia epimyces CBS 606.96 TaxID=1182542 RepID=W9Y410_9EURO|nr:uncharacterized protein A1O3_04212 [Capronia epimyces CBS 606.96]EXJ87253.1 hypothetical protein A1O3_04212 [Capronia epimyces CBS 606.96]
MRLLQLNSDGSIKRTGYLYSGIQIPKYAILSHTWLDDEDEVSFEDFDNGHAEQKTGYEKIRFCGAQAAKDSLEYFWVDTCCIPRSNNTELQEAITSMFKWYRNATKCYVYLTDVDVSEGEANDASSSRLWESALRRSRWFTRGWTLQELLAPASVEFFSVQGTRLGDKKSLEQYILEITGIPPQALRGEPLAKFSVAERLSWAETRQTKRKEDRAYSLLGVFAIFMPLMYGEGDHAFTRLQQEIERKHAESARQDALLSTLPTAPQAAFNSFNNQHASTCLPNTRVELLQNITEWADGSDDRCIFWLNGTAGTGKSTVARTVARTYHDRGNLGASFFFSRGGGDVSHSDKLFTTLASQLATKIPSIRRHIYGAIMAQKDIAAQSLRDQWDQLILNPLSMLDTRAAPPAIVLVLDALDECDSERDIRIVLRLLATTRLSTGKVRLRIFITSRPETPIRCGFSQIPEAERQVFVLQDILPTIVDRDLSLFFEHSFASIREERDFPPDWPGMRVITRLVEISCGLFIWASTACRFIREGRRLAMRRITILINGHRSGAGPEKQLDEIYTTVLRDSTQQGYNEEEKQEVYQTLREVLGSIVTLLSPLSTESLVHLLRKTPQHIDETLADLHTIFNIPAQKNRPIRLHHPTFRDFLLNKNRCSDLNFWVDEKQAHRTLADNCIQLMSRMLRRNICGLDSPGALVRDVDPSLIEERIPPELQYACLYWVQHYRHSGTRLQDNDPAHRFFQKHFLHWLEAVNLIGKSAEAAAVIRMYHSLLMPADNLHQLAFVKDARRFIFAFQSIIEYAPLQTYCAALSFIRPTNELKHHFGREMHPWIKQVRIAEAIAPEAKDEYNYVNDISFTPDGRQVASGSVNEVVRLWDVATKATSFKLVGQTEKVSSVAISPGGRMIASGSDDATVMVWDMRTRAVLHSLGGHSRWVNSVVFSPDGKLLASGSMDETVRVWDVVKGKEINMFDGSSSCVNSVAFSPDGSLIASGTVDCVVRLWAVDTGEIRVMLDGHSGCINSVRFSPDGRRIVSGSDDMTIRVWDTATETEIMSLKGHLKKVMAVTFSPDARLIASGSEDRTVRLWNATTGVTLATLVGHTSGINAVTFSPDGQILASGSFDDEVRLWAAETGESLGKLDDFDSDDVEPGFQLVQQWTKGEATSDLDLDEKGTLASTAATLVEKEEFKGHASTVLCVVPSPDGRSVASGSHDTTIKVWTVEGVERLKLEGHSGSISHLEFSPNSHLLASTSTDKTVRLWSMETGAELHTLRGHSGTVRHAQFSSDGRLLASCSIDKTIRLWDTATGTVVHSLEGHVDTVNRVAFSAADKHNCNHLLASCSADTTIMLWDLATGQRRTTFRGHVDAVNSVAFSRDGQMLVSCSADRTVRLWTTESGTMCGIFKGHTLPVNSAAFSPDNKLVVSCADDETVRLWSLETGSPRAVLNVAVVVRAVAFASSSRAIHTDRGVLDVDSLPLTSPPSPSGELDLDSVLVNISLEDGQQTLADHLFVTKDWLKRGAENTLWLPDEYHATSVATTSSTTWGDAIVLGHPSGSISFISL